MAETPHLNPLPSSEGRGGSMRARDARRGSKSFGAMQRPYYVATFLMGLWILAVVVRLILINQPYVDHWSWRQSDVAAVARNFSEGGFRFAHPQIDWAGDATGYVGTEFPILPFVAALCYKIAGIHEWIGRSQSVIFFAVSLPFFFLLVREIFGGIAALWATFFFSFAPLNIFAGRSFMPDVPSLSLAIIGLYFVLRCANNGRLLLFLLAAIAISLSLLIKITSIIIFAPLAYWAVAAVYDRRARDDFGAHRAPLQLQFVLFLAITLLPSAAWYWHAHQIAQRFYPHHFFGAGGIRIENLSWYWSIARQTATSSLTAILSIMAVVGCFVAPHLQRGSTAGRPRSRYSHLFYWWLAAMLLFIIIVGYGNRHRWYQLPLVPIAAAFAGAACAFIGSKIASSRVVAFMLSILLAGSFSLLAYVYVRPLYEPSAAQLRDAGLELNRITAPDALIVAADMGDPTIFYYAQRKGWHFLEKDAIYAGNPSDSQEVIADFEQLRRRGATHFVFTTNTFWWLDYYPEFTRHLAENAEPMEVTAEFRIYKLTAAR
jgi:4-amino-4-deoxy-L-arabinose transferase-like glycosyltransferase